MNKIKVLVVDDSALMRKIISDMIDSQKNMEVIKTARNGQDLFDKLERFTPDIITLDVEMPKMDGLTALKELKRRKIGIPVIVLSSISKKGTQLTMDCLQLGAFDFLPKPSGAISLDINEVKEELVAKIAAAYKKPKTVPKKSEKDIAKEEIASVKLFRKEKFNYKGNQKIEAVVIGASTGGPKALYKVITALPEKIGVPVFVVQHMPQGFTKAFAERLNLNSSIKVVEARDKEIIKKDIVYIAPGGYHMEVGKDKRIHLNTEPAIWGVRPAVDKLFVSASKIYGSNILSVVLTGMGKDGSQGTVAIKEGGGITIAEDESTCVIYGMPKAAYKTGKVDQVLPIDYIGKEITNIVQKSRR